jgi:signal transduction histidine kinase
MQCRRRHHENPAQSFCGECGAPLTSAGEGAARAAADPDLQRALADALAQQTATSEILRVISSSPTDVRPVFNAIVASALRLCDAVDCGVFRVESGLVHLVAHNHQSPETLRALARAWPTPVENPASQVCRAIQERAIVHLGDTENDPTVPESNRERIRAIDVRSMLVVPLLRGGIATGAIRVSRREPTPFSDTQIDLLKTFANQAVIAIQNAHLFREIADKSRQLETASRHKSEFLANMSHELRTPLNAIIGFSEVLAERMFGEVNAKQAEYLQDILESGRHLLSLINDILDLSKIEAGHMELEPADYDLPGLIENALILVRERASRRGITLGRTIDEHLGVVHGDERKVKQVLLNLLSNALKFTPEGGRIDVGAGLHGEMAQVSVADTGVGIAPADQEAVFEEFRQVGAAEKKAEGTGLGLALSRKFVELHGGTIWVESEPGHGATFTFTLPVSL